MKPRFLLAMGATSLAGIFSGHLVCGSISCRNMIGRWFGRGELIALAHGSGIYEADLDRRLRESQYRYGDDESDATNGAAQRSTLIADTVLNFAAHNEQPSPASLTREFELLQSQFADKATWMSAWRANDIYSWRLRARIAKNLRGRIWIEAQIAAQILPSDEECYAYFDQHRSEFVQPVRFRASHLFLAAPEGTTEEIVDAKRRTVEQLEVRLKAGEKFPDLVNSFSEDEATKKFTGDLGYFSEFRMPVDFVDAVRRLKVGEISSIVQTKLGFHIILLTDLRGERQMTVDEARDEIADRITNAKRRLALQNLVSSLASRPDFRP